MSAATLEPEVVHSDGGTVAPMVHLAEDEWATHALCGARLQMSPGTVLDPEPDADCVVCVDLDAVDCA